MREKSVLAEPATKPQTTGVVATQRMTDISSGRRTCQAVAPRAAKPTGTVTAGTPRNVHGAQNDASPV